MKKVLVKKSLIYLGIFLLILLDFKMFSITTVGRKYHTYYLWEEYASARGEAEKLLVFNVFESYIAHYNHGNTLFKEQEYIKAEKAFTAALKRRPPAKRICAIQVNLALSIVAQARVLDEEDAKETLKRAREVLYLNGCASESGDGGKSIEARETDRLIRNHEKGLHDQENKNNQNQNENPNNASKVEQKVEDRLKEQLKENQRKRQQEEQERLNRNKATINVEKNW